MGVPKFYKWISERYPCLSVVVRDYQIPEFDNLYLDMNGIIHNCSHPNDDDPHFRITEEQIFKDIFHYIEVLFRMIQPRKVFFMAIDGVAPRAKMNQQRGRRFRSAREAEENEKKALLKGEVLPSEQRFDSNCITPGTEFMTKLDAQLQYFVSSKISNDKLWQGCTVIYSGHKTPGEGEHKIMEYIRYSRSQPNFDPNTRHCLYGLDADLMMLGLTSHEPHFSLLREEVRFGGKNNSKQTATPEETTFHLLHLSLMREYIEYEFYELRESLPFKFDIESIIDDWVFMGFLVGNDFIPHLPGLHINKDALPILYETYKKSLPALDGYLNEGGLLNLKRFEVFMENLTEFDIEQFQEHNDNIKYLKGKRGDQKEIEERMNKMEAFEFEEEVDDNTFGAIEECSLSSVEVSERLARLGIEQDPAFANLSDNDDSETEDEETQFEAEFRQHKRHYYMTKLMIEEVTPDVLRDQVTHYIRGIQWILHYYYNGITSWSWYYPFHYAPYISDIKDFADIELIFDKGKPFLPFEQLLGVLPPLSVKLLPEAFAKLMLSESSSIIEYYPKEFATDLNGKLQDWEAVVLIPFIDEKRLLDAMKLCNEALQPDEKNRNSHGPMFIVNYTSEILGEYKAPQYFPSVQVNHANVQLVWREEWDMHPADFIKTLLPGVRHDLYFAGFPTLKHIEHTFRKGQESIKVFQQPSRSDSFILEVTKRSAPSLEDIAKNILGSSVFVSWPHLIEAKVVSVCNAQERYSVSADNSAPIHETCNNHEKDYFSLLVEDLKTSLHIRWGVDIKETKVIVFAKPMSGRSYVAGCDGNITLEKQWSELDQPFPYQTIVKDIATFDPGYKQFITLQEYFSMGSKVFMIGHPYYGSMGEVMEIDPEHKGRVPISIMSSIEPNFQYVMKDWEQYSKRYMTGGECASRLGMSPHLFARITGTLFMGAPLQLNPFQDKDTKNKLSIGLSLKNNKKNEEVLGFTRKCPESKQWLYSFDCIDAIKEYHEKFPEIFNFLNKNGPNMDVFQDEVFPDNYKEKVPELTKWLKEAAFASASRCKCGSVFLDPSIVSRVSEEVDKVIKLRAIYIKMKVKPHLLYKPNQLQGCTPPDPSVRFQMFDRIINTRDGFSVPLGLRGTIIGIRPAEKEADKLYDILFDESFLGGLTFAGPSSANRCYRLHWAAMLNLTHGERLKNGVMCSNSTMPSGFARILMQQAKRYKQNNYAGAIRNDYRSNSNEQNGNKFHHSVANSSSKINILQNRSSGSEQELPPILPMTTRSSQCKKQRPRHSLRFSVQDLPIIPIMTRSSQCKEQMPSHSSSVSINVIEESENMDEDSKADQQPPDPNQLPQPLNFKGNTASPQQKKQNLEKDGAKVITSEKDVPFIMHGNFFAHLALILEKGLRKDQRDCVPCVSYIPPKVGARTFQIYVYLNVKKLLQDGIRLILLSGGQVLCGTTSEGFLSPHYIDKIFDVENECVIFPRPSQPQNMFSSPVVNKPGFLNSPKKGEIVGRGRGKVMTNPVKETHPIKIYENIWSQMKELNPSYPVCGSSIPIQALPQKEKESRKEVSVLDLFQLASENSHSNLPKPFILPFKSPCHQINHIKPPSITPQKFAQSPSNSQFVPTQVIRNQTPRKQMLTESNNSVKTLSDKSACMKPTRSSAGLEDISANKYQSPTSSVHKPTKPKKKARSRIAANFDAFYGNNES